ncbi:MAG: cobalamin-binding protein [Alphaproteobacteria bacterium]|nr:cobalamin-binding protein [Alphaproteobacteria bacterium]
MSDTVPKALRIVSLLPSATEVVAAIGLGSQLVGRSHECDYPPGLSAVPVVTRPRIDPAKPSRGLHRNVTKLITKALSVFEVDAERLRALRPDVILTQHQCAACAVTEDDLAAALAKWTGAAPRIVSLAPSTLKEVWASFGVIGEALDHRWAGRELAEHARERVSIIGHRAPALATRPTVVAIEWLDPPMIAGNWVPDLITAAGGTPVLATSGQHSELIALKDIAAADPEMMVLMPCGFDLARTEAEATAFLARKTIARMRTVREGRVWAADGSAYFNRPGPRLITSIEILSEILHPGAFNFGHEGSSWRRIG